MKITKLYIMFKDLGIIATYKTKHTLERSFENVENKTKSVKKSGIYGIMCNRCNKKY